MTKEKLTLGNVDFSYSISVQETKGKKEEVVFYFSIIADTENDGIASKLEDFNKLLRRINSECGGMFVINTIWDDVSIYYAKKLYPGMI